MNNRLIRKDLARNRAVSLAIVLFITASGATPLTICGIYSDITNGGKTAKAAFTDTSTEAA